MLDSGAHAFLVERIGAHRTLELVYTTRLLSGTEAVQMGIFNRAMPRDQVLDELRTLAAQVAQGPTTAFMESKRLVRRIRDDQLRLPEVLAAEAKAQGVAGRTADYREGITAFQEKRTPKFTGR